MKLALLFCFLTAFAAAGPSQTDLLIVGCTESGWAAAIQSARMGCKSITLVHDGSWLGGHIVARVRLRRKHQAGHAGGNHLSPFPSKTSWNCGSILRDDDLHPATQS